MRWFFLFLLIFSLPHLSWGQIDSLKNELNDKHIATAQKTKIFNSLAQAYWSIQQDSADQYANLAIALAKKTKDSITLASALIQKSRILDNEQKEYQAFALLREALVIAQKNGLQKTVAEIDYYMGKTFSNNPDSSLFYYNRSIKLTKDLGLNTLALKNKIASSLILLHQKRHQELSTLFEKIIPKLEQSNNTEGLIEVFTYMAFTFRDLDQEDKALHYASKALALTKDIQNLRLKAFVLGGIGSGITSYYETLEKALPLVKESLALSKTINSPFMISTNQKRIALLYYNADDYPQATLILDSLLAHQTSDPDVFTLKASILTQQGKYILANTYYQKAFQMFEKNKAYIQQKMLLQDKIDNKLLLIKDHELTRDFSLLDSLTTLINNTESKKQFFNLETKYRTAEKEAELHKKQLALEKSKNRNWIISGFSIFILMSGMASVWILRSRQKKQELEDANHLLQLKQSLNEMELSNLNNQLNPHEVKNLITSFAPDMIRKAPEAYKKMIKLFNVTRASLSNKLTEPLDAQLKQVQDYLELQQSISPYPWDFELENEMNEEELELPRLLLKNLAENAVKHGIKPNKDQGSIKIKLERNDSYYKIEVKDNGNGLNNKTQEIDPNSTKIGLASYQRFFYLTNKQNQQNAELSLNREGNWTVAKILIPLNYQYP